ncbi:ABC transporter substrate-binding protein [Microbulbifer sp. 2201CG32-9]|uniref:ABC transporter substrate-binding protein n=1 Tax=Microbulbifer sp. 2201CG32-9 TaxID=3232309 RepID=UPI00345BE02E
MKWCCGLLLSCLVLPASAYERIASLNLCLDQLLLNWVAPEKIASVTWLSANDQYRRAPLPEHVYLNRGQAEELLHLRPDLVLVGQYGGGRAAARLQELGVQVVRIPDAHNLEQLEQQLHQLQQVLGPLPRLLAQRRRLRQLLDRTAVDTSSRNRPGALILSANNITYGDGMLEHQLLQQAGFANLAAEQGIHQLGRVSLEQVIAAQPELLVFYGGDSAFALAHLASRHPVLRRYIDSGRIYTLPAELGYCPALVAVEVLSQLEEKRKTLGE